MSSEGNTEKLSDVSANLPEETRQATATYKFNHTMLRIKDPKISLDFYQRVLGMEVIDTKSGSDFTLYFLCFKREDLPRTHREAILELTHNHGTEDDSSFGGYKSGNEPDFKGFGHIAITVGDGSNAQDSLEKACARFDKLGVKFHKRPEDGKMKNIAFILDPDGYWIEIIGQ